MKPIRSEMRVPNDWPATWIAHTQTLLKSYRRWTQRELIARCGTVAEQAIALFHSPLVVVSHGAQADPILNYGNQRALELWEMDIATLCQTPSRLTAEPLHRDERARLLERTTQDGYVDDYQGIRISRTGRRFVIEQAVVWNLLDERERYVGQAAMFGQWTLLPKSD